MPLSVRNYLRHSLCACGDGRSTPLELKIQLYVDVDDVDITIWIASNIDTAKGINGV